MKHFGYSRLIFNTGVDVLKILLFTVAVMMVFKFTAKEHFSTTFSDQVLIIYGLIFSFVLVLYDFISQIAQKLVGKVHQNVDENEAISILEKHGMKVGILLTDLPRDQNKTELVECVNAFVALKNQQRPFVFINDKNEISGRVFLLGAHGRADHNKYKLMVQRDLSKGPYHAGSK